jgi:hypothetical protein
MAVSQVNAGQCREAVDLLDVLITHHPTNVGAFAARGTARALLGRLAGAQGGRQRKEGEERERKRKRKRKREGVPWLWVGGGTQPFGRYAVCGSSFQACGLLLNASLWLPPWLPYVPALF